MPQRRIRRRQKMFMVIVQEFNEKRTLNHFLRNCQIIKITITYYITIQYVRERVGTFLSQKTNELYEAYKAIISLHTAED